MSPFPHQQHQHRPLACSLRPNGGEYYGLKSYSIPLPFYYHGWPTVELLSIHCSSPSPSFSLPQHPCHLMKGKYWHRNGREALREWERKADRELNLSVDITAWRTEFYWIDKNRVTKAAYSNCKSDDELSSTTSGFWNPKVLLPLLSSALKIAEMGFITKKEIVSRSTSEK